MKCLALASGKGGVGKTFLTASFGLALARQGASVLLLDGDMGLRNLDIPLGMEKQTRYTSWDLARGRCFEEDSILTVMPHLDFLPAAEEEDWKAVSRPALSTVLEDLADRYDYILIDCPAGLGKGIRFAEKAADAWLIVVGPSWASRRDALKTAACIGKQGRAALIFNDFQTGSDAGVSLAELIGSVDGLQVAGVIPHSSKGNRLAQQGRLKEYQRDSAFGEAVELTLKSFLTGTVYPLSRWQSLLQKAKKEECERENRPAGSAGSLLLRQRAKAARWRRR